MKFIHIYITLIFFEGAMSNFTHVKLYRPLHRIIGGRAASICSYPSTASLILKGPEGPDFRGGAVIISEYWALTAAHCMNYVTNSDVRDRIAFVRSNSANWMEHYHEHLIIERHVHEMYNNTITDYDMAVLKVEQPFKGRHEKPARLPRKNYKYLDSSIATVMGWGTTDANALDPFVVETLRSVNIRITNHHVCRILFKRVHEQITDRMICAISPGKDACVYDSGGPLYQNGYLIGLVSWGSNKCAHLFLPGVYTKVSIFHDWIMQKIRN